MSNLSEFFPSGGGQNEANFVASGTISSGEPVVLLDDGTISSVSNAQADYFEIEANGSTVFMASVFDSNSNKVVIAYEDNNNAGKGTAVVGTVSGGSITFGTPVVFETASAESISMAFDSNSNKVVIAYEDDLNSDYGAAIVGTVSGTSISFGTKVVFHSGDSTYLSAVFDSNANKIVISWRSITGEDVARAIVGNVSGTSISFGTSVVFHSNTSTWLSSAFDSNLNKVVIAWRDSIQDKGFAIVGTVSGTSISFGTAVAFNDKDVDYTSTTFDSTSNKIVIGFRSYNAIISPYRITVCPAVVVGTVSGTSISFGTVNLFENTNGSSSYAYINVIYDLNRNKTLFCYRDTFSLVTALGTVSGSNISFTALNATFDYGNYVNGIFDSNSNEIVITYKNTQSTSSYVNSLVSVIYSENLATSFEFIGIAASDISDGTSGAVNLYGGINEAQTGLTIGADYYVQNDGSLSTTESDIKVGQAISATTINMMDLT